jgi:tetratricopeptide (TPR) repeat protein
MPPATVEWQPALVVLGAGVVLGALLVWWLSRRGAAAAPPVPEAPPVELRDLDGKLRALLAQLGELDDLAAKRTPEQLARERYALELEAARTLQARDALAADAERQAAKAEPTATPARGGSGRGFLWGAASSAAVGLLLYFVSQSAERRPEGGSVTGSTPGASAPAPGAAPEDAETRALRARLEQNPEDHDLRLELARHLLMQRDLMGVWNETQHVLEHEPGQPRALAYQALVRLAMGQGELAVSMLQQAIAADPELLEARQNLAFVYASLGRTKEAEATVAEVRRRSPEEADRLQQALAQLGDARAAQAASAPPEEDPHAGVAPPVAAGVAPSAAAGGSPAAVTAPRPGEPTGVYGWIEADAAVAGRIRPGTVVFLTVREAGVAQGPPVAVKRLTATAFPLQFELGTADSMMGQPLPERMRIDARADADGDAATRSESDPKGFADGVELGKTGVRIPLR